MERNERSPSVSYKIPLGHAMRFLLLPPLRFPSLPLSLRFPSLLSRLLHIIVQEREKFRTNAKRYRVRSHISIFPSSMQTMSHQCKQSQHYPINPYLNTIIQVKRQDERKGNLKLIHYPRISTMSPLTPLHTRANPIRAEERCSYKIILSNVT